MSEIGWHFDSPYQCFSASMFPNGDKQDLDNGGKILVPVEILHQYVAFGIQYPMLFKITNIKSNRITHCGVFEFVAPKKRVYLPRWMMHNLLLEEGDSTIIESATLPVATFSRFQPHSSNFLEITDPKAVLENSLRNFTCLTTGDMIEVNYNDQIYELFVLETKPADAVNIIECDMKVEFAPPLNYKTPEIPAEIGKIGQGNRLNGKPVAECTGSVPTSTKPIPAIRGIPDYNYEIGTLTFDRTPKPKNDSKKTEVKKFVAFSGPGNSMK